MIPRTALACAAIGLAMMGACQTMPADGPALLSMGDRASLDALRSGLASALGRPHVTLGADDPTTASAVSVLPPPLGQYETRSLAMPTVFDLAFRDGACVAIQRDTGTVHQLPGVSCVVPKPAAR
jgi:hypothetical protein